MDMGRNHWWRFLLVLAVANAFAQDKVRLQLKWDHQFQFAGYYAAVSKGFYEKEGLVVQFIEGSAQINVSKKVLEGVADFGVGTSELLIEKAHGKEIVVLAAIFQHSAQALLALQENSVQSVHDLIGKKVALKNGSAELKAYLLRMGIQPGMVDLQNSSNSIQELKERKVAAISAYTSYEPYYFKKNSIPYVLYSPRLAGIDFYGDNLFTSSQMVESHPELVDKFRRASLAGWDYAMKNPLEIVALIQSKYSNKFDSQELLWQYEQMVDLIHSDFIQIGHINPGRWQHISDVYKSLGMIPESFDCKKGFLYDVEFEKSHYRRYVMWFIGGVFVISILVLLVIRYSSMSVSLKRVVEESKHIESSLRESEKLYRSIFTVCPDSILITDRLGLIQKISPSTQQLLGIVNSNQIIGKSVLDFLQVEERIRAASNIQRTYKEGNIGPIVYKAFHGSGRTFSVEVNADVIENVDPDKSRLVLVARDVTERIEDLQRMEEKSFTDSLTGLANRRRFDEIMEKEVSRHIRTTSEMSLLLIDVDFFKQYNDSLGHLAGDICLKQMALALSQSMQRPADLCVRFGGEEFACILPDTTLEGAVHIAEKIRVKIESLCIPHPNSVVSEWVTVSIGVCSARGVPGFSSRAIIEETDVLLYESKANGRNRISTRKLSHAVSLMQFTWNDSLLSGHPGIDEEHRNLFDLANELLTAVSNDMSFANSIYHRLLKDFAEHCRQEEKILEVLKFGGLDEHALIHSELYRKLQHSVLRVESGEKLLLENVYFLLQEIVINHVAYADCKYYPLLRSFPIDGRAILG